MTTHKFAVVLNRQYSLTQQINALGHMSAGITAHVNDVDALSFRDFEDADGSSHPFISDHPFIVLQARNSGQLSKLRDQAIAEAVSYTDFPDVLLTADLQAQIDAIKHNPSNQLQYVGVCVFGQYETISLDNVTYVLNLPEMAAGNVPFFILRNGKVRQGKILP